MKPRNGVRAELARLQSVADRTNSTELKEIARNIQSALDRGESVSKDYVSVIIPPE